jgi:hypothetical protein
MRWAGHDRPRASRSWTGFSTRSPQRFHLERVLARTLGCSGRGRFLHCGSVDDGRSGRYHVFFTIDLASRKVDIAGIVPEPHGRLTAREKAADAQLILQPICLPFNRNCISEELPRRSKTDLASAEPCGKRFLQFGPFEPWALDGTTANRVCCPGSAAALSLLNTEQPIQRHRT